MKLNILEFYPGEIFFSWVSRMYLQSGKGQEAFLREMFDSKVLTLYKVKPFKNPIKKIEHEHILLNHSVIPIFKPFSSEQVYKGIMEGKKDLCIMKTAIKGYKVCPLCCQEDMNMLGETYLRIEHQIEGNVICYTHQVDLIEIEEYKTGTQTKLMNIGEILEKIPIRNEYNQDIYYDISEMIYKIHQGSIKEMFLEDTRRKYFSRLEELGYYTHTLINQKKLANDFKQYYGDKVLDQLDANFEVDEGPTWIKRVLFAKKDEVVSPIRHLLMIKFLFGSIEAFSGYEEKVNEPFGKGPWKCINPVCEKYQERCIETFDKRRGDRTGRVRGRWKCKYCGMEYSKIGPVKEEEIYLRGVVIEYGHVWKDRFIEACNDETMKLSDIAEYMKCSRYLVKRKIVEYNICHRM